MQEVVWVIKILNSKLYMHYIIVKKRERHKIQLLKKKRKIQEYKKVLIKKQFKNIHLQY
jgi:hypothetical protein